MDQQYHEILCAGCSFTQCRKPEPSGELIEYPYASLLPGTTYNIGERGGGVRSRRFKGFFKKYPDVNLTHVVYQVPCPTRQPADLNDYDDGHFRVRFTPDFIKTNWPGDTKHQKHLLLHSIGVTVWAQLSKGTRHPNSSLQAFDKKDQYLKKAIDMVDINVKLIREQNPNMKIIFLRYEDTLKPLIYEFSKNFYKLMLTDYCKENNITYIYEENFNTKWFKKNACGVHPNKAGAKLIADKIKEYL
jgi:hypothetical protein